MGVTLQDGTVHECAGVALVRVTCNVLLDLATVARCELPLKTGGESAAATATQTGIQNGLDNLVGGHFAQSLLQCEVTVHSDILVNIFRVDHTAVTQRNSLLLLVEGGLAQGSCLQLLLAACSVGLVVNQTLYDSTLLQMLGNDLGDVVKRDSGIEGAFGINDHDRTESAKTEATGQNDLDFLIQTLGLEFLCQLFAQLNAARRATAGTAANQYMRTNHNSLILLDYFLFALMVYSATGLPPLMCFSITSAAFSAVILT